MGWDEQYESRLTGWLNERILGKRIYTIFRISKDMDEKVYLA